MKLDGADVIGTMKRQGQKEEQNILIKNRIIHPVSE